jgi:tRNA (guanine37-N1)-methyltransferase
VLAVVEAVARLLPGVVGNAESLVEESHQDGLLEYPVYTRPATWRGREVPPVLMSGHHGQVARWRRDERLHRTARRRPDLVAALDPDALDAADLAVLAEHGWLPTGQDAGPDEPRRFLTQHAPVAD